jgi:HD-like signal output (HDOD) protein
MMEKEPKDRFQNYVELQAAIRQVEKYRYETQAIITPSDEEVEIPVPVQPRSQIPAHLLYGLLSASNSEWARVKSNAVSTTYTHTQVIATFKEKNNNKPLAVEGLVTSLRDLCFQKEGDFNDMLQSMEEIPGLRDSIFQLAYFVAQDEAGEVTDDEIALETIGLVRARNLALFHFSLAFEWHPIRSFDYHPLWQHQLATALIMDLLYESLAIKRSGLEFPAGLYHDVGKLILSEMYPYGYYGALTRTITEQVPLSHCEVDFLGLDHLQMAEYWLREKKLPYGLVDAIAHHEDPDLSRKHALLAHAICSANHLAQQLGLGYSGNAVMPPCPWDQHPSTAYVWEHRTHDEFTWDEFVHHFLAQFENFPELLAPAS